MLTRHHDHSNGNLIAQAKHMKLPRIDITKMAPKVFYIIHQLWIKIMDRCLVKEQMKLVNNHNHVSFKLF